MLLLLLFLLFQSRGEDDRGHAVLEREHARAEDAGELREGLSSSDPTSQRAAVRAIGRLERPELSDLVIPLLNARDRDVRLEAVNALAQMKAVVDWAALSSTERDSVVRGAIYEATGRVPPATVEAERALVAGLVDRDPVARVGAAKGLEAMIRLNRATMKPAAETVAALRLAVRENRSASLRELVLLTLNGAGDRDEPTLREALRDPNPQVRRLAVIGLKEHVRDSSPLVRYEALRLAPSCERAQQALSDASDHVVLLAVDLLGEQKCDPRAIERLVDAGKGWRVRAHALVSLAKTDSVAAIRRLDGFARDPVWQARVHVAQATRIVGDSRILARLAADTEPNVVAAAINSADDAIRALSSSHYGLILTAARYLKGSAELTRATPALSAALARLTRDGRATSRDPRLEILERLREAGETQLAGELRRLLSDLDPVIARRSAEIVTSLTGEPANAGTLRYSAEPFPSAETLRSLDGATARITMQGLGEFTVRLFPADAPATVATFARLADQGYYNGLTFHRVVPNFVIQGGSPGANEYDGIGPFMRDEVGLRSHTRGTLGISTRGRDTGDAQIFVNLVDNFRLDHQYTVFAEVIDGMSVVDRVQEGDVMASVRIVRASPGRRR